WEFNHKGACVGSFSSPRANAKEVNLFGTSAQRQRELLMSEVEEFCAALSQWIRDRSWARPPAPPNRDSLKLVDYDAPGIFSVVLAADPSTYGSMPTSSRDRRLHFGLTDREWEVLY